MQRHDVNTLSQISFYDQLRHTRSKSSCLRLLFGDLFRRFTANLQALVIKAAYASLIGETGRRAEQGMIYSGIYAGRANDYEGLVGDPGGSFETRTCVLHSWSIASSSRNAHLLSLSLCHTHTQTNTNTLKISNGYRWRCSTKSELGMPHRPSDGPCRQIKTNIQVDSQKCT